MRPSACMSHSASYVTATSAKRSRRRSRDAFALRCPHANAGDRRNLVHRSCDRAAAGEPRRRRHRPAPGRQARPRSGRSGTSRQTAPIWPTVSRVDARGRFDAVFDHGLRLGEGHDGQSGRGRGAELRTRADSLCLHVERRRLWPGVRLTSRARRWLQDDYPNPYAQHKASS